MAKHLLFDYEFDASAKTITLNDIYAQKVFLLITNVNDGEIIFAFNDAAKGISNIEFDYENVQTTITLEYDTTSMADTDPLQIFIDEQSAVFSPADEYIDPVSKIRVSNPENLIDTDFEYGQIAFSHIKLKHSFNSLVAFLKLIHLYSQLAFTLVQNLKLLPLVPLQQMERLIVR